MKTYISNGYIPVKAFKRIAVCLLMFLTVTLVAVCNGEEEMSGTAEKRDWNSVIGQADTNVAMKEKADQAIEALNRRMSAVIENLEKKLNAGQQQLLDKAQTAWQKKATAESSLLASKFRGGTHEGLEARMVKVNMLKARITELLEFADNFDSQ